jgi:hypothetical protein
MTWQTLKAIQPSLEFLEFLVKTRLGAAASVESLGLEEV